MKKFFGREKGKAKGAIDPSTGQTDYHPHPSHLYHHHDRPQSAGTMSSDDHWSVIDPDPQIFKPRPSLPGPLSSTGVPLSFSPRPVSPANSNSTPSTPQPQKSRNGKDRDRDQQVLRKKVPPGGNSLAAVGILKALDPHPLVPPESINAVEPSEDSMTEVSYRGEDKKERKGFWDRSLRDSSKEWKDDAVHTDLTRMIGYLTATASEDWSLVLEVCERASATESNAKQAVKALRREFKYAEPSAQLSAARLWAIMLRNCTEVFVWQCASRKFLDTLEDVITSPRTSPVVRERLMEVLAAAAFAGTSTKEAGFRHLWRKVKPADKPDEGVPFDTVDAMFYPPTPRHSSIPSTPPASDLPRPAVSPRSQSAMLPTRPKSSSRQRVIPLEEDIRRLFQECKVGKGNAAFLSENLTFAKPEDLKQKDVIREFYARCRASQELISAQIPWAFAGAEKSRQAAGRGDRPRKEEPRTPLEQNRNSAADADHKGDLTTEELLLAALLSANEDLLEALRVYDDLERVGIERDAQERSKKETRIDRSKLRYDDNELSMYLEPGPTNPSGASSSRSPSPSPSISPPPSFVITPVVPSLTHPLPPIPSNWSANNTQQQSANGPQSLAPPPHAPIGPRSPVHSLPRSRTPSPERRPGSQSSQDSLEPPHSSLGQDMSNLRLHDDDWTDLEGECLTPVRPSAKALGKRKIMESVEPERNFDTDDMYYEHNDDTLRTIDDAVESDSDDERGRARHHHATQYVYDAAAERTQQRIKEGRLAAAALVGSVH